jgi:endonuclease III
MSVVAIIIDTMRDEQAEEIIEDLKEYYANPEAYSLADLEDIFQDRDPFEFL